MYTDINAFDDLSEDGREFDTMEELIEFLEDEFHSNTRRSTIRLTPPGDCSWSRHNELQRRVRSACDRPRACEGRVGCGVLRKRGIRSVQCVNARGAINRECYRGGDPEHWREERAAARTANECRRLFRTSSCRGRQFFD
jgi:hypothetical protein